MYVRIPEDRKGVLMAILTRIRVFFSSLIKLVEIHNEGIREFDQRAAAFKKELVHDPSVLDDELEDRYLKGLEAIRSEISATAKGRIEAEKKRAQEALSR